jgi:hypothetical protein
MAPQSPTVKASLISNSTISMDVVHGKDIGGLLLFEPAFILFWKTFLLATSLICGYFITSSIYSLTLHPLADVPGPKLCGISRIPYWLKSIRGRDVHWLHELHTRYGSVVRFGPTDLSYATAQAWKDIHGYGNGKVENAKAPEFSVQPVNGTSYSSSVWL